MQRLIRSRLKSVQSKKSSQAVSRREKSQDGCGSGSARRKPKIVKTVRSSHIIR